MKKNERFKSLYDKSIKFDCININNIKSIFINYNYVVIICIDNNIVFYMMNAYVDNWYHKIKKLDDIKTIKYTNKYLICTMDDGRFLIMNNASGYQNTNDFVEYFDVERYVVGCGCIAIVHFNGLIEKVYSSHSKSFLINDSMSIREILFENYNPKQVYIPYITVREKLKIYNTETEDFIELTELLDIDHILPLNNNFELKLKENTIGSYI